MRYAGLAAKLREEWEAAGTHRAPTDTRFDPLVLHTADDASYAEIVGAMDAAYSVTRACAGNARCPAFRVVFASAEAPPRRTKPNDVAPGRGLPSSS